MLLNGKSSVGIAHELRGEKKTMKTQRKNSSSFNLGLGCRFSIGHILFSSICRDLCLKLAGFQRLSTYVVNLVNNEGFTLFCCRCLSKVWEGVSPVRWGGTS